MKLKQQLSLMMSAIMIALNIPTPSYGLGLAARFGDIVVEHAQIGRTYNLRETLKIPLGIENRSDDEVEVVIEFEQPKEGFLKENYEMIPDPSWLKALPERMRIGPNAQGFFDLLLTIPNDESLNGRHFQALVKARTVGTGLFGVAVENRLRFSVGPGPETLKEEKRQKAMSQLDFDVTPQTIYVNDIEVGQKVDVRKHNRKTIRVANYAADPLEIQLKSEAWNSKLYKPQGYEPIPDPSWITFKKDTAKIDPESIGIFQMIIKVPNDPKYKGKKYAAYIRSGLVTGFWLDAPVRIYFSTK